MDASPVNIEQFPAEHLINVPIDTPYTSVKVMIERKRNALRHTTISIDSISQIFTSLLVEKLIPHWLSTPWSFDGHTPVPGEGHIACVYFVSTTLQDMGFNLNRYLFAQQLPMHEAKTISPGDPLTEINSPSKEERIRQLNIQLKEGIYFIGFNLNHVGYIQKKKSQLLLIYSNFINAEGVVIKPVETSQVFSYYHRLYIAGISTNRKLMEMWLNGERISIINQ